VTTGTTGFIGLGRMGAGMALNLLAQQPGLVVFDQDDKALLRLREAGATVAASAEDLLRECQRVFLCLPSSKQVQQVLFDHDTLFTAEASAADKIIIDTTTLDRTDAKSLGQRVRETGADYADCPVSGLPARADNGTLTMMFGGRRTSFDQVRPMLASMGEDLRYCGEVGSGQAMKAINNIIYNINIAALCEVLPLATAAGLDPEEVASVVRSASSRSFASEYFVPRMFERQFHSDFSLENAYKDIVNVQGMAIETRAMTPLVNAMTASYQSAIAAGYGDEPKSAMLKVYEAALGVEFSAGGHKSNNTDA